MYRDIEEMDDGCEDVVGYPAMEFLSEGLTAGDPVSLLSLAAKP